MATKTDNHNPAAKLELRRHFLRKYHSGDDPADVLDCCQGSGLLWGKLREEFKLAGYWGLDVKPKKGRLKIDSMRVLQQSGWRQNVIDIDTYGSPWRHWLALQSNVRKPLTVFLTIGQYQMGISRHEVKSLGLDSLDVPPGIIRKLHGLSASYCLTRCCDFGNIISEAVEAVSSGNSRYLGLRLEKANGQATANCRAALNATEAERSNGHV